MQDQTSEIVFNPDVAKESCATEEYQEGWVRGIVTNAKKAVSKPKPGGISPRYFGLALNVIPLTDPENADSGIGRGLLEWQCMPWEPAFWKDTFPEDVLKKLRSNLGIFTRTSNPLMSALFPDDVPQRPVKLDGTWYFNGDEMPSDSYASYNRVAAEATVDKLRKVWGEGATGKLAIDIDGYALYFKIEIDDEGRAQIADGTFSVEHPVEDGELVELLTGKEVMVSGVPDLPEGYEAKSNGAAKPKAAKKKAKKAAPKTSKKTAKKTKVGRRG